MIGCMSHPKKTTSLCYLQNYRLSRQKLFRIKNNLNFSFVFNIGCMSQPEKATSTCYLGKYWFLRLDTKEGRCLQSKKQLKWFFQIKIWMSHPEKLTPPCYLANCRFLRIVHGTKIVQNQKTISGKYDLHHRMFESIRKSYIIMLLSRKLLTVENKKMTFVIGCMKSSEKATSSCYLPNYWLLTADYVAKVV